MADNILTEDGFLLLTEAGDVLSPEQQVPGIMSSITGVPIDYDGIGDGLVIVRMQITQAEFEAAGGQPGGGSPVLPARADMLYDLDFSDPGRVTQDGSGRITLVADASPAGNDFTSDGAGTRPRHDAAGLEGRGCAVFDGSAYLIRDDVLGMGPNPAFTVLVLCAFDAHEGVIDGIFGFGARSATAGEVIYGAAGEQGLSWRFNNGNRIFTEVPPLTETRLAVFARPAGGRYDSGTAWSMGGAALAQASSANGAARPDISGGVSVIGCGFDPVAGAPGNGVVARIGRIVCWNRELTVAELNAARIALAPHYGLTTTAFTPA